MTVAEDDDCEERNLVLLTIIVLLRVTFGTVHRGISGIVSDAGVIFSNWKALL